MAASTPFKNAQLDAAGAAYTWFSLHSGDPGTTGANPLAGSTRQQTTWSAAVGGSKAGTAVPIAVVGGSTATHWGLWTTATAGQFGIGGALPVPETFGGAGTLTLNPTLTYP